MAPRVSIGHRANAMLAAVHISNTEEETVHGKPWPPNSGSQAKPFHPPATNCA